jgi:flagella basal body P-ring formation protein FlgA
VNASGRVLCALALWLVATAAAAVGIEPLSRIQRSALARVHASVPVHARVKARAEPLDRRLRLAACGKPLQTSLPGGRVRGNRVSVAVRCLGPQPWTVRVAVDVRVYRRVLVTTRALVRGDHISAPDVTAQERDVSTLGYGYVTDLAQIEHRAMARPVSAGAVLTPSMLAHREVVRRGDRVTLLAAIGSVSVRASGMALAGGDDGQRVRVRNVSSGQVVDATVVGPGVVRALP